MTIAAAQTFRMTPDEDVCIVRSEHFWSEDEIQHHFDGVEKVLSRMRARSGIGRMLVDLTGAGAQSKEANNRIYDRAKTLHQKGDRVAFITSSALLVRQLRRVEGLAEYGYFGNDAAALKWLRCPD